MFQRSRHHRDSVTTSPSTTRIPLLETSNNFCGCIKRCDNIINSFPDPCLVHYCPKGHECIVDTNEEAVCVCQRQCPPAGRRKLVCGSDGHIYPSHCEMHRAACMQETIISVQRGVHCIKQGKGWAPGLSVATTPVQELHESQVFTEIVTTVVPTVAPPEQSVSNLCNDLKVSGLSHKIVNNG